MEDPLLHRALSLLIDATYDVDLPADDLMLHLAGAAIGFGLEVACDYSEYVDLLLLSNEHRLLDEFVTAFATASVQDQISETAAATGAPPLAVLVKLVIECYRDIGGVPDAEGLRRYGTALSRFCLRFTLALWSKCPALAMHYRQFVPT